MLRCDGLNFVCGVRFIDDDRKGAHLTFPKPTKIYEIKCFNSETSGRWTPLCFSWQCPRVCQPYLWWVPCRNFRTSHTQEAAALSSVLAQEEQIKEGAENVAGFKRIRIPLSNAHRPKPPRTPPAGTPPRAPPIAGCRGILTNSSFFTTGFRLPLASQEVWSFRGNNVRNGSSVLGLLL